MDALQTGGMSMDWVRRRASSVAEDFVKRRASSVAGTRRSVRESVDVTLRPRNNTRASFSRVRAESTWKPHARAFHAGFDEGALAEAVEDAAIDDKKLDGQRIELEKTLRRRVCANMGQVVAGFITSFEIMIHCIALAGVLPLQSSALGTIQRISVVTKGAVRVGQCLAQCGSAAQADDLTSPTPCACR